MTENFFPKDHIYPEIDPSISLITLANGISLKVRDKAGLPKVIKTDGTRGLMQICDDFDNPLEDLVNVTKNRLSDATDRDELMVITGIFGELFYDLSELSRSRNATTEVASVASLSLLVSARLSSLRAIEQHSPRWQS